MKSPVASPTKQPKTDRASRIEIVQEQEKLRSRPRGRFERLNVVIAILIAGWVPSILMLVVSYTILTKTLESKIQRDRQSFVQLIAHLVGDDLARSGEIVAFYQTYPPVANIFTARYPDVAAKKWLQETYFTHPRIDGMFITTADGRLIASVPGRSGEDAGRSDLEVVARRRAHGARLLCLASAPALAGQSANHRSR